MVILLFSFMVMHNELKDISN